MSFALTAEQSAIVDAAVRGDNVFVTAYAGCAKTSTMVLTAQALPEGRAVALAFNAKIRDELKLRFPEWFDVLTLNGLGHRAWGRTVSKNLTLDDKKLGRLVSAQCKAEDLTADGTWDHLRQLVTWAMLKGLVPSKFQFPSWVPDTLETWTKLQEDRDLDPNLELARAAREVLIKSIGEAYAGTISFDDQIYMPTCFGGQFPRWPIVMVDEAQDLSRLNHEMVKRCASGQLIVVGDPKQAIYGFRGADSNSMEKLVKLRPEWTRLKLSTTFRCPKLVVERQIEHAPGFNAWEGNKAGKVDLLGKEGPWRWSDVLAYLPAPDAPVAVLCRNNAPLLEFAFKLIRRRVGVVMLGRDIGKGLVALSKKVLKDDSLPNDQCQKLVALWMAKEIDLARANDQDEKIDKITDQGECLLAVLDSGEAQTAGELRLDLKQLFSRKYGQVELATGHKAKGLEWPVVLHLDPSRARREHNLRYVIETRSQEVLLFGDLEKFE